MAAKKKKAPTCRTPGKGILSDRDRQFCHEFISCWSYREAARRVGLKENTINQTVERPEIIAELHRLVKGKLTKANVSGDRLLEELQSIAHQDPSEYFKPDGSFKDVNEIPEEARRALAGVDITERHEEDALGSLVRIRTVKLRFHSKLDALDKLAKYLKLYNDTLQFSGTIDHQGGLSEQSLAEMAEQLRTERDPSLMESDED